MKYYSDAQALEISIIKAGHIVIYEESFEREAFDVSILCEMQDKAGDPIYYRKYSVSKYGETSYIDYKPVEESGDESFDVVVEEELKEEKKVIDLRDTYSELIEEYIRRHDRELKDYADECKLSAFTSYAEDSLQDVIETVISNYYDNYDFDDVSFNDEDIEQMLIDNDILE